MAKKPASNAVIQTRSSSKPVKPLKTAQLATPPPEPGTNTTDTHQGPQGDTDKVAPADKGKKTPRQRQNDSIPTLEALPVKPNLDDLGENESKETQAVSAVSDHEEGTDHDAPPDSPITHVFSRDPLTGEKKITKATFYCSMSRHILMRLPALRDNLEKRLFIQSALGRELADKKRKFDEKMKKDEIGNYVEAPNRISPAELTKRGIDKQDLKLIGAGYQVPKDGIPPSQLSRRKGRVVWKYDNKHPNAWCLVTRDNKEGKDGDEKGAIWILAMRQWTDWKGGSSRKEIEEIWAACGTPVPVKHDEESDEDEDKSEDGNDNEIEDGDQDEDEDTDEEDAKNEG